MQKIIIIGNVGKEPEIKEFENGGKIAIFSMAVNERGFTTKSGTVIPDRTEWFNITVSGGYVDVVEKHINKGDRLYIEGKQRTRKYESDGVTKYITEVQVSEMEMLGGGKSTKQNEPDITSDDGNDDLPF